MKMSCILVSIKRMNLEVFFKNLKDEKVYRNFIKHNELKTYTTAYHTLELIDIEEHCTIKKHETTQPYKANYSKR